MVRPRLARLPGRRTAHGFTYSCPLPLSLFSSQSIRPCDSARHPHHLLQATAMHTAQDNILCHSIRCRLAGTTPALPCRTLIPMGANCLMTRLQQSRAGSEKHLPPKRLAGKNYERPGPNQTHGSNHIGGAPTGLPILTVPSGEPSIMS